MFCSLDCISVAIQEEHEVLTVGSELQLEVLLLVVEEERLHHLVLPQLEERLARLSTLRGWVSEEGSFNLDNEVVAISFQTDNNRVVVNRESVPRSGNLELLTS